MIPLFINLMLILGLSGVVAYTVYSYQRSSEIVSYAQRNAARMDQVGFTIRASLRPVEMGGRVRAPLGDPSGPPVAVKRSASNPAQAQNSADQICIDGLAGYRAGNPSAAFNAACRRMGVPSWIVSDDRTPWGARYAYCPYSLDPVANPVPGAPASTTGAIRTGDGSGGAYNVRIVRSRGRDYVQQSDVQAIATADGTGTNNAKEEVVGFLLSPPPFVSDEFNPSCGDVAKVDGAWIVRPSPGNYPGSVVPVLSRGIGTGQVANQGEVVLYAGPTDSTPGTGLPPTGDTPADALSFANVLDLWHLTPWKATTINLAGGNYPFASTDATPGGGPRLQIATAYPGRSISLRGASGTTITNNGSGTLDVVVSVDASIDGVSFGSGVQLRVTNGARVTVTNGSLGHVRVDGGDLTLGAGTSVTQDLGVNPATGIDVTSGTLRLSGGSFGIAGSGLSAAGIYVMGGALVIDGTDVTMRLPAGRQTVAVLEGARVSVAPKASGTLPSMAVVGDNGTLSGPLGADMTAYQQCTGGTETCVAACSMQGEATGVLRIAMGGSCAAMDAPAGQDGNPQPQETRPELYRSARGDVLTGVRADAGSWVCRWKPGQVYNSVAMPTGGSVNSYAGPATLPALRASARCAPNPTLLAP